MTFCLGIDIGGTKIAGAVVSEDGQIVRQARVLTPAPEGGPAVLRAALGLAHALWENNIQAVGIGTGGIVDATRGVVLSASDILPGWAGTDVDGAFEAAFAVPAFVDNDVNALAAGEARWGAARGARTAVVVALGTGVGGAVLLNGKLHHGAHFAAGEIGRMIIGNDSTLEDGANGAALHVLRQQLDPAWDGTHWDANDPFTLRALAETGEQLGLGLVNICALLDPDVIIIGGGLSAWGDSLLEPARAVLRKRLPFLPCPVVRVALGPDASVVGAAALAFAGLDAPSILPPAVGAS